MKKKSFFLFRILPEIILLLPLIFAAVSCRSKDPMDPYRDLGAPRGMKNTYPDEAIRNRKKNKNTSFFQKLFEEDREKKRRFRDVSRPMPQGTVEVFPWKGDNRRSEELHGEIRREKRNME